MARVDASVVRLTVAFNEIVERGLEAELPLDLRGDAIPSQVLQHEAALTGKAGSSAGESGARGEAGAVYDATDRMLVRVRHGVLSSFADENDPRIDELGPLGLASNQTDNQTRLANLATTLVPHIAAGTIALVPDLQPDALKAQADRHAAINKAKGGATANRQTVAKSLREERADTSNMLKRVKGFLVAHGQSLEAFGFDLPVPPSRPRLVRGEPTPTT